MEDFPQMCEDLWLELEPLYKELHAYVRRKLMEKFPMGEFPTEGHIPAHLLGLFCESYQLFTVVSNLFAARKFA